MARHPHQDAPARLTGFLARRAGRALWRVVALGLAAVGAVYALVVVVAVVPAALEARGPAATTLGQGDRWPGVAGLLVFATVLGAATVAILRRAAAWPLVRAGVAVAVGLAWVAAGLLFVLPGA